MITIEPAMVKINRLTLAVGKARRSMGRELAAAINETTKKGQNEMARNIRSVVNMKAGAAKKAVRTGKRATAENLVGVTSIPKESRKGWGLQHFGGRQTKKGVTYRINKVGGRSMISGAFMGPRPGQLAPKLHGGVFKRIGANRLPIVKLYGVSPFGAYTKNNFEPTDVLFIEKTLNEQVDRRINLNVLRASGLVKT